MYPHHNSETGDGWYICIIEPFQGFSSWAPICGNSPFSEEMWSIRGAGQSGGTPSIIFHDISTVSQRYRESVSDATAVLKKDGCRHLFPGIRNSSLVDVSSVFQKLMSDSGERGGVRVEANSAMSPYVPMSVRTRTFSVFGVVLSTSITVMVNSRSDSSFMAPAGFSGYGDLLNSGMTPSDAMVRDRAHTVIHECGHVVSALYGQSATLIKDDQGNPAQSLANGRLVSENVK